MKPLYEISNQYVEIVRKIEDTDDYEFFKDTLEGLQGLAEDKIIAMAAVYKNFEYQESAISDVIDNMRKRQSQLKNKLEILKNKILNSCIDFDINSITKSPYLSIKIKGKESKLIIEDEGLLPIQYISEVIKVERIINKDLIKQHLKSGDQIEGAKLGINKRVEIK